MYCLTFDVDWAPDPVIEDTLLFLERAGVRATFFATHASAALRDAAAEGHEIDLVGTRRAEALYRTDEAAFEAFVDEVGAPFFNDARGCPLIACSDGAIRLEEIEIEGDKGHEAAQATMLNRLRQRLF